MSSLSNPTPYLLDEQSKVEEVGEVIKQVKIKTEKVKISNKVSKKK